MTSEDIKHQFIIIIIQELGESRWPSWAVRPNEPSGFRGRKAIIIEPCSRIGLVPNMFLASEDIKQKENERTHWLVPNMSTNTRVH